MRALRHTVRQWLFPVAKRAGQPVVVNFSVDIKMTTTFVTFNNGLQFPLVGLGTWQSPPDEVKAAVRVALDTGYRHIDTAFLYQNEEAIGEVLQEYFKAGKLKREDVYITTKLPMMYMKEEKVPEALDLSLKALQLDYVDLYLIHAPLGFNATGRGFPFPENEDGSPATHPTDHVAIWRAMEAAVHAGKAKSIGLSNFNARQVKRICENCTILPVTNQVECHAYLSQKKLQDFMAKWGILVTSFASLGSPGRPARIKKETEPVPLQDPLVLELAETYKRTPAQILLRHLMQRNILVIPKSVTASRIQENFQLFDFTISDGDQQRLLNLDRGYRYFTFTAMDHPEYPFNEEF